MPKFHEIRQCLPISMVLIGHNEGAVEQREIADLACAVLTERERDAGITETWDPSSIARWCLLRIRRKTCAVSRWNPSPHVTLFGMGCCHQSSLTRRSILHG